MSDEFVFVSPADPLTAAGDMAVSSVPAVVAYLGLAVLDAIREHSDDGVSPDSYILLEPDGALFVHVDVWHPRPRLLAELRRAGVIE